MNKLFLLAMLMVTPFTAFAQEGSINGSVGVSNDYFFRGVSQIPTGGPAWNVMLEGEHSGFFGGAWAGAVEVEYWTRNFIFYCKCIKSAEY